MMEIQVQSRQPLWFLDGCYHTPCPSDHWSTPPLVPHCGWSHPRVLGFRWYNLVSETLWSTCKLLFGKKLNSPLIQVTAPYARLSPVQDCSGQGGDARLVSAHSNKLLSGPIHAGLMKYGGVDGDEQSEPLVAPAWVSYNVYNML